VDDASPQLILNGGGKKRQMLVSISKKKEEVEKNLQFDRALFSSLAPVMGSPPPPRRGRRSPSPSSPVMRAQAGGGLGRVNGSRVARERRKPFRRYRRQPHSLPFLRGLLRKCSQPPPRPAWPRAPPPPSPRAHTRASCPGRFSGWTGYTGTRRGEGGRARLGSRRPSEGNPRGKSSAARGGVREKVLTEAFRAGPKHVISRPGLRKWRPE